MLTEAEQAYHLLMIGQGVARLRDQNGEMVEYAKTDISALYSYIQWLKSQLNQPAASVGPMRVWM